MTCVRWPTVGDVSRAARRRRRLLCYPCHLPPRRCAAAAAAAAASAVQCGAAPRRVCGRGARLCDVRKTKPSTATGAPAAVRFGRCTRKRTAAAILSVGDKCVAEAVPPTPTRPVLGRAHATFVTRPAYAQVRRRFTRPRSCHVITRSIPYGLPYNDNIINRRPR